MKKRWIGIVLSLILLFCFATFSACGDGNPTVPPGDTQTPGGDTTTPGGDEEVPLPPSNDDCVFTDTSLTIEAGEFAYINFTGTASSFVTSAPETVSVQYVGNGRLKVTALQEGRARIQGYTKQAKPIKAAKCDVTVTQSLKISLPAALESAVNVPYAVPYIAKGQDKTTQMDVEVTNAAGVCTWEQEDTSVIIHPTAEGKIGVKITLTKDSTLKGHEVVSASTEITFVDFFQDKYYDTKYFAFTRSAESVPEEFEAMPDPTVKQYQIDRILADRESNHPTEPDPDPETPDPTPDPENPDESQSTRSKQALTTARTADIIEGYTVALSEGVLNGTIPLPESFVIPAYYKGEGDAEARPVNKIAENFMRAFAEYSGELKSEHKEPFTKPFAGFTGLNVKNVYIPASVTEIGADAFSETTIRAVQLQKGSALTVIGRHAFFRSAELRSFNFADCTNLQTIGSGAFTDHCMTEIFIPKSVTVIGKAAFAQIANDANRNHHTTLKEVVFEDDDGEGHEARAVTVYGGTAVAPSDGAFAYNLGLKKVRLCNIKRVQSGMFFQAWGLEDVYVDAATGEWAFSPYLYHSKDWQFDPDLDVSAAGVRNGAYILIDHNGNWGNPFVFACNSSLTTTLTIDNAMIEDLRDLPYAAMDYDSRGLLGYRGQTAESASAYTFGEVFVKDTLTPSAWFTELYEQSDAGTQKAGYTRYILKNR